jgi:hypothetical protein
MRKVLTGSLFLLVLAACNNSGSDKKSSADSSSGETLRNPPSDNALTDEEKKEGWQLLFDGQTTKGWHKYGGAPAGAAWKAENGILYLDTSSKKDWQTANGGDIATDQEYANFDLKLEWKISPKGNSGIIFLVHEDTAKFDYSFKSGPEMQIVDNEGHEDGKIIKHQAGDLYDLISSSVKAAKPVGEWNQAEIKVEYAKLDLYLNGENVVSTSLWDDNWKKMIARSKFKEWPGFGTYKQGRICLQDHGNQVSFRNIKLKSL